MWQTGTYIYQNDQKYQNDLETPERTKYFITEKGFDIYCGS